MREEIKEILKIRRYSIEKIENESKTLVSADVRVCFFNFWAEQQNISASEYCAMKFLERGMIAYLSTYYFNGNFYARILLLMPFLEEK